MSWALFEESCHSEDRVLKNVVRVLSIQPRVREGESPAQQCGQCGIMWEAEGIVGSLLGEKERFFTINIFFSLWWSGWYRISLHITDYPGTHCVDQANHELIHCLLLLGLKAYAIMSVLTISFWFSCISFSGPASLTSGLITTPLLALGSYCSGAAFMKWTWDVQFFNMYLVCYQFSSKHSFGFILRDFVFIKPKRCPCLFETYFSNHISWCHFTHFSEVWRLSVWPLGGTSSHFVFSNSEDVGSLQAK